MDIVPKRQRIKLKRRFSMFKTHQFYRFHFTEIVRLVITVLIVNNLSAAAFI